MSKLYASISSDASKTEATRRGHRSISCHTRGWTLGTRVDARIDGHGNETFDVYVTSGSNGGPADEYIGNVALHNGYRYWFPADRRDIHGHEVGTQIDAAQEEGFDRGYSAAIRAPMPSYPRGVASD